MSALTSPSDADPSRLSHIDHDSDPIDPLERLSHSEKVAYALLNCGAVLFSPDEPFVFKSGLRSPIYLDNRLVASFPEQRDLIMSEFERVLTHEIGLENIDHIAGTESSAIGPAAILADRVRKPYGYARKEKKGHGTERGYEGKIEQGQRVVVIEDHISTGGSSLRTVESALEQGGDVRNCIAVTIYQPDAARAEFESRGINLITLTDGQTIVSTALKMSDYLPEGRRITEDQAVAILEWMSDMKGWSDRYIDEHPPVNP